MAISETMSNFSDWMQLYQNNFSITQPDQTTPPTTTTITTAAVANTSTAADSSRNNISLSPDQGRISKPIRRRSRASRRTPTTLLNTDITNFRAMVQQFTGGPAARTQLSNGGGTSSFGGIGTQQISGNPAMTPSSGFFFQYPNQLQQQQQQQQQVFMSSLQNMQLDRSGSGSGGVSSHAPPQGSSSTNDQNRDINNYML